MAHLCPSAVQWSKVPLDQLSNQTVVMLSGLVSNQHKLLVRGELGPNDTIYPGCSCRCADDKTSSTLIHPLSNCPKTERVGSILGAAEPLAKISAVIMEEDKSVTKIQALKTLTKLVI